MNSEVKTTLKSKNKIDIDSEEFKNFDITFNEILKSQEKYKEMDQKTEVLFPVSKKLLEKYGDPIKYNDTYSYKNDKELIVNKALNKYFELTNNN